MSKIKLNYKNKIYILEYTRNTTKRIEESGFSLDEIGTKPSKMIPLLWEGAFLKNYPRISASTLNAMYETQTNKRGLIEALMTMYAETINTLFGDEEEEVDEKNQTWELD